MVSLSIETRAALRDFVRFFPGGRSGVGDERGEVLVEGDAAGFEGCDVGEVEFDIGCEVGGARG